MTHSFFFFFSFFFLPTFPIHVSAGKKWSKESGLTVKFKSLKNKKTKVKLKKLHLYNANRASPTGRL
jgi:hypothetical protein